MARTPNETSNLSFLRPEEIYVRRRGEFIYYGKANDSGNAVLKPSIVDDEFSDGYTTQSGTVGLTARHYSRG